MAAKGPIDEYSPDEAERRLKSALRGARIAGAPAEKTVTPKQSRAQAKKGRPSKTAPSSRVSRASAKTERP